jgi:hypothetical protein
VNVITHKNFVINFSFYFIILIARNFVAQSPSISQDHTRQWMENTVILDSSTKYSEYLWHTVAGVTAYLVAKGLVITPVTNLKVCIVNHLIIKLTISLSRKLESHLLEVLDLFA